MVSYCSYDSTTSSTTTGNEPVWRMWNTQKAESDATTITSSTTYEIRESTWKKWHITYDLTDTKNAKSAMIWYRWVVDQETKTRPTIHHNAGDTGTIWINWNEEFEYQPARQISEPQRRIPGNTDALRREVNAETARRKAADKAAKDLLMELIGEDKRTEYERTGCIFFHGKTHDYIIKDYGHVKQIERSGHIQELCVHLSDYGLYPDTDNVIALLLAFQFDEQATIKTANKHGRKHFSKYDEKQLEAAGIPLNYFKNLTNRERNDNALSALRKGDRFKSAGRASQSRRTKPAPIGIQRRAP